MTASSTRPRPQPIELYVATPAWPLLKLPISTLEVLIRDRDVIVVRAPDFDVRQLTDQMESERLLDHHWILYLKGDLEGRRIAERCLFDRIAGRYEIEVDSARNGQNYQILLRAVGALPGYRILDFGCGPGSTSRDMENFSVIGCDVSNAMLTRAAARGLRVVRPNELEHLEGSLDSVIASYVLHLAVPHDDLVSAARCLRVGGRFAANFHKARGILETVKALMDAGSFTSLGSTRSMDQLHGKIRAWERID